MTTTKKNAGTAQLFIALALAIPSAAAIYFAQITPNEYSSYAWFIAGACVFLPYNYLKKIPDVTGQHQAHAKLGVSATDMAFEGAILDYLNQEDHKDLSQLPEAIKRHPIRIAIENAINRVQHKN